MYNDEQQTDGTYDVDETVEMKFNVDDYTLVGLTTRKNLTIVSSVEQIRKQSLGTIQSFCSQAITAFRL